MTNLDDLDKDADKDALFDDRVPNDPNDIFDFALTGEARMKLLMELEEDKLDEVVRKLTIIYNMSPLKFLEKCIYDIATCSFAPLATRLVCADTLLYVEHSRKTGTQALLQLVRDADFASLHFRVRFKYFTLLLNDLLAEEKKDQETERETTDQETTEREENATIATPVVAVVAMFKAMLIRDESVSIETRYVAINEVNVPEYPRLTYECCEEFIREELNWSDLRYVTLACQYLLQHRPKPRTPKTPKNPSSPSPAVANPVLDALLTIATNQEYAHRRRADACDTILRFYPYHKVASDVLVQLGGGEACASMYENKENVHTQDIQKSTIEIIDFLSVDLTTQAGMKPYEEYATEYRKLAKLAKGDHEDTEDRQDREAKVQSALLRMLLDVSVTHTCTLQYIFRMVCAYIDSHPDHTVELQKRMIEELVDMAGTCSSGFCSRLVNVLSGFTEHTLSIGWDEQIQANLMGRLNAKLREEEESVRGEILEQMTNRELADRSKFYEFFRTHISCIKETMYEEFKAHIRDEEWDLYFRNAIIHYEH